MNAHTYADTHKNTNNKIIMMMMMMITKLFATWFNPNLLLSEFISS